MKVVIHDRPAAFSQQLRGDDVLVLEADGKYAPCRGCFECWVKTPGTCTMKDKLKDLNAVISACDELVIITENCYGGFSPAVKTYFDRSIGTALPFIKFYEHQMAHCGRYNRRQQLRVYAYGDFSGEEKDTFRNMVDRVRRNYAFETAELFFVSEAELEGVAV